MLQCMHLVRPSAGRWQRSLRVRSRVAAMALVTCLLLSRGTHAQSIFTFAGGGSYVGDGRPATDVSIENPYGIALDAAGNVYFTQGGVVERITKTGILETVAGNGAAGFGGDGRPAKYATLNDPLGVFVEQSSGDVYIADSGNGRVRKVDAKSGIITTVAGCNCARNGFGDGGPAVDAILEGPDAVWFQAGNLYIVEGTWSGNRIRRVGPDGIISTIAGSTVPFPGGDGTTAGYGGDGDLAVNSFLNSPLGVAVDAAGNVFIADSYNNRVRRVDAVTKKIETYAGTGNKGTEGDGSPATEANVGLPSGLTFDASGNLVVLTSGRYRVIDKNPPHVIQTIWKPSPYDGDYAVAMDASGNIYACDTSGGAVLRHLATAKVDSDPDFLAGFGKYVGDGLLATEALVQEPRAVAVDREGNVFIGEAHSRIRRVDAVTGRISRIAGAGSCGNGQDDGKPATEAAVYPFDLEFGPDGLLYFANGECGPVARIERIEQDGTVKYIAGGGNPPNGNNDGLPGKDSYLRDVRGIGFSGGTLYIPDCHEHRVWALDPQGIMHAFAGTGALGHDGDEGPALQATFDCPRDVVADKLGNIYIADVNGIRTVTPDGKIHLFTLPGAGDPPSGDDGPVDKAFVGADHMTYSARENAIYAADVFFYRIRKIDLDTRIIKSVAGTSLNYQHGGFLGDNGPANAALLNRPTAVAFNAQGDYFIADTDNNRVRKVSGCPDVSAAILSAPANGESSVSTSPALTWSAAPGAVRYDLLLDTNPTPTTAFATNLDATTFTPANLQPATTYYWRVVARSDAFCKTVTSAESEVFSFTTSSDCIAGAFDLNTPADRASGLPLPVTLSWSASAGASKYDLYLGVTNPPPLLTAGSTNTFATVQATGTVYWFVVAHAACDETRTSTTPVRSFTTAGGPVCTPAPALALGSPSQGAIDVSTTVTLNWAGTGAIDAYDVYFGTTSPPPLLSSGLAPSAQTIALPPLTNATTYYWRVVMRSSCVAGGTLDSGERHFTTRAECRRPGRASILFAPQSAVAGSTYAIVWSAATDVGAGGGYLVERSTTASFDSIYDAQITSSTAASFLGAGSGTLYHRVRVLPGCDLTSPGDPSDSKTVTFVKSPPNVIFTVPPQSVIVPLNDRLESYVSTFTLENISDTAASVIIGRQELGDSPSFFNVQTGSDSAFVTLQPHKPQTFVIRFSGPPNDTAGSYEGVIVVAGANLPVTPYAFVNLKVGGVAADATPQFFVDGEPADYVSFDGFQGSDALRPSRTVTIRNPGGVAMDLSAEIGPEVWLQPASEWNKDPIPGGVSRDVALKTRRSFAPEGSPLPRYTYFTVRTPDGRSARLLVQDNDRPAVSSARTGAIDTTSRSFIVPEVVSRTSPAGHRLVTQLRLTNLGGDAVQADVIFTPADTDGFDPALVKRATVVVPPNDVVTITDPTRQLFQLDVTEGTIEVRLPRDRVGLIAVRASIVALGANGGFDTPVVPSGEGARSGAPHEIDLVGSLPVALTLTETSGNDGASVTVASLDANGNSTGSVTRQLPRYGMTRLDGLNAASLRITVNAGGGAVTGVATLASIGGEAGAVFVSSSVDQMAAAAAAAALLSSPTDAAPVTVTTVIPIVAASTRISLALKGVPAGAFTDFSLTLRNVDGTPAAQKSIRVNGGQQSVYDLLGIFNAAPRQGSVFVQSPPGVKVCAVAEASAGTSTVPTSSLPLPTTLSEALTGFNTSARRVLEFDGMSQSTDASRGDRWLLVLNEVGGASGTVNVRLYEAANRTSPIAQAEFTLAPYAQQTLDSVFSALGLDTNDRRKDRTNVQVVVTATGGNARIAASAVAISPDGQTHVHALVPAVGSGTPNLTFAAPVITQSSAGGRRRAVRR